MTQNNNNQSLAALKYGHGKIQEREVVIADQNLFDSISFTITQKTPVTGGGGDGIPISSFTIDRDMNVRFNPNIASDGDELQEEIARLKALNKKQLEVIEEWIDSNSPEDAISKIKNLFEDLRNPKCPLPNPHISTGEK